MNFTFTDFGNAMLSMVQSQSSLPMKTDSKISGSKDQLFEHKLGKILEKGKPVESQNLSDVILETNSEGNGKFVDFLKEQLGDKKGIDFLSELKKILMALSGGDLNNLSINEQGLATLKQLLSKAGFDSSELDDLIAELTEDMEDGKLNIADLFDQLFELPLDSDKDFETQPEQFLETSFLPFIESILTALNIPDETIQEILGAADKGERGISLDVIIDKLQEIQKKAFHTHTRYQSKTGDDNLDALLKALNMETRVAASEPVTLNDIVSSFENMRHRSLQKNTMESGVFSADKNVNGTQQPADLIKDLFQGFEMGKMPKEKHVFDFSADQVKHQFKNELLASENTAVNQKGLFAPEKDSKSLKGQNVKEGLKDLASALEQKTSKNSGLQESMSDAKELSKQLKNRTSALTDSSQASVSESKTTETQTGQAVLKSKATFKNLPNFVTQQVSKSVIRAINQGENTLRIQLKPPELGRLVLTIDNSGSQMKVHIVTENAATREILASNANEIKTVLSNSGVNLERFDVDMNSDFRQSMADAKNQAGQSHKRQQNRARQAISEVENDLTSNTINLMEAIEQGQSMHFVA